MVAWYVVCTIFIVLGIIALIWGLVALFCGIRNEDQYGMGHGITGLGFTVFLGTWLWVMGFPWGGAYFEWIKTFFAENATTLKFVAGILFCTVGIPLFFIIVALIKFLFIDTRKQASNKSKDDKKKEREEEDARQQAEDVKE